MYIPMTRIAMALMLYALVFTPLAAAKAPPASTQPDAAEELMVTIHVDVAMNQMTEIMLKTQIEQNPKLADFEDIMRGFLLKYVSFDALKQDLIRLYKEHFTESELRKMTAFYRTQTGQKCVDLMPTIMQKGGDLGRTLVAEHMDELKAAVEARVKELSKPDEPPSEIETAPTPD